MNISIQKSCMYFWKYDIILLYINDIIVSQQTLINPEKFIKYSAILERNMSDPKTLEVMINKLRVKTSRCDKKALMVIDAGIVTEDNLKMICDKGYDYMCVSRSTFEESYHGGRCSHGVLQTTRTQR